MSAERPLARGLVRLYPPSWRERYGEEYLALLSDAALGPRAVLDVLRGAADAWLRPSAGVLCGTARLRATVSTVWCAWIALVAGALIYGQMTEDRPFRVYDAAHPGVGVLYRTYEVAAVLSVLVIAAGGAPLWWALVRQAVREGRRSTVALLTMPFVAPVAFLAVLIAISRIAPRSPVPGVGIGPVWFGVAALLGAAAGCLGAIAPIAALRRLTPPPALLRLAVRAAAVGTTLIGLATLAGLAYAIALRVDGGALDPTVIYAQFLVPYLVVAGVAGGVAAVSLARGLRSAGGGDHGAAPA